MPRAASADLTAIPGSRRPAPTAAVAADGASRRTRIPAADEDDLGRSGPVPRLNTWPNLGGEPGSFQQHEPGIPAKRPEPVCFRNDSYRAVCVAQREFVFGEDPVVARNGVAGPFAEARMPAGAVMPAASPGTGTEGLGRMVRREDGQAARAAVLEGRVDDVG